MALIPPKYNYHQFIHPYEQQHSHNETQRIQKIFKNPKTLINQQQLSKSTTTPYAKILQRIDKINSKMSISNTIIFKKSPILNNNDKKEINNVLQQRKQQFVNIF